MQEHASAFIADTPFAVELTMLARTALVRSVARASAKRSMSDAPKMHKFKDCSAQLKATRPPPDPHEHVSSDVVNLLEYGNCLVMEILNFVLQRDFQ